MKLIEICAVKGLPKKKNGFYWHVVILAKKFIGTSKKGNVKYAGTGIDTLSNTKRAAKNHSNNDLKKPLPIYHRGKLIG